MYWRGYVLKSRPFILYIFLAFLIAVSVVLIVNRKNSEIDIEEKNEIEKVKIEELASLEKVKVYDALKGEIRELDLNYYLFCTTASEIPFEYEIEAIKAQAIVSRTYLYNKILTNAEKDADICTDYRHCQAFLELNKLEEIWKEKGFSDEEIAVGERKIKEAVETTDGIIITYNGTAINALFHASSPICTENAKAIWSNEDVPYLKSVENVEDENYERRNSQTIVDYEDFKNGLKSKKYFDNLSFEDFQNTKINEYTETGRVKNVKVGNAIVKAEDLRTLFGLNSTLFTIDIEENKIIFNVTGFGHGVGMSQVGANHYAKDGYTYEQIIHHYYTGVELENIKRGKI